MARRNREVNIFNMSLLDILCGALGAFCFMMLALLPYYKPPGTESDVRENQQKTNDLVKRIDEANRKMGDSPAVKDLRKLVEELKKQIQEMQGQLNQALSKVEELTKKNTLLAAQNAELQGQLNLAIDSIASLSKENEALAKSNAALTAENERLKEMLKKTTTAEALAQLQKRIEQLQEQMQQLADKNVELDQRVKARTPITISLRFDTTQSVDICLENVFGGTGAKRFDPSTKRSALLWSDDVYTYVGGLSTYTLIESPATAEYRIFVNLVTSPQSAIRTVVTMSIHYGPWPNLTAPELALTPQRPWQFYGTIKKGKDGKLSFTPASAAARDAVWIRLSGQPVPATPAPFIPPPRPTPPKPRSDPEPTRRITPVPGQKPWMKATPPPFPNTTAPATPVKP